MALFELAADTIRPITETTFSLAGIRERGDLQRLLRTQAAVVSPDTLIVAEEFGQWEDSKRRIDLLGVDREANLVVIELKRTEDGGHMELQAVRYAAMVSTMTFEQVVRVYTDFLQRSGSAIDARESLLDFLGWEEPNEDQFGQDVRIVLVSAEFSKELTTAVLWLNERGLDIRCVRIKPYADNGRVLVDVQQVIPLPEAVEYQVRVRDKEQRTHGGKRQRKSLPGVWQALEAKCSPEEAQAAHDLGDWLVGLGADLQPTPSAFVPHFHIDGSDHRLIKVRVDGGLVMLFGYLARKPPFADEALRRELLRRLNQLPGVSIPEERLSGKPWFPLSVLVNSDALARFKETVEWAVQQIRSCSPE